MPDVAHDRPTDSTFGRVHVDLLTNPPGSVENDPIAAHRLLVHVGPASRGFWQFHDVLYSSGDIDFIPAGLSENWEQVDPAIVLDVRLSASLVRRAAEELGLDPAAAAIEPNCQFRDPQIEHIARALEAERRTGHQSGRLFADSLGLALACRLVGPGTEPDPPDRGLPPRKLRVVTDYIEEHLDQELTLAHLAGVAGLSASHFKTLFRRSTGLPVHRYVVERRVSRAATLLLAGRMPASQVAAAVGFSHQSHMARWMRRILGVTPTALVRQARD